MPRREASGEEHIVAAAERGTRYEPPMLVLLLACHGEDPAVLRVAVRSAVPGRPDIGNPEIEALVRGTMIGVSEGCPPKLEPGIVVAWSASADGRELRWTLSGDHRWSDGAPITAADVVEGWKRRSKPDEGPYRPTGVVADDATHVRWTFAEPGPALERHLGAAKLGVARGDPGAAGAPTAGPWRIVDDETLEPSPGWPGPAPAVHRIRAVRLATAEDQVRALEAGEVDVVDGVPVAAVGDLAEKHKEIAVHRLDRGRLTAVTWDPSGGLANVRVRRALWQAIDRDALVARFASSDGQIWARRADRLLPPSACGAVADDLPAIEHDLEGAKATLAEAGWTDHDGDGRADQRGATLAVSWRTDAATDQAPAIVADLQAAGVEVRPAADPRTDTRLATWRISGHPPSLPAASRAAEDAVRRAEAATDPRVAEESWKEAQRLTWADPPAAFLYWTDDIVAVNRRFGNVRLDPDALLRHVDTWTVAPPR